MARPRVEPDRLRELIRLRREGVSERRTAGLLRMGPNTARRYRAALKAAELLDGPAEQLPSVDEVADAVRAAFPPATPPPAPLDPWRGRIEVLLEKGLSARATFDRLRVDTRGEARPFNASYSAVKRAYRRIKRERGLRPQDVAIPVEGEPGEAQVDFGYAGKLYDPARGVLRRAWVFVLLLTRSRLQFVRLVFDQKVETWLALHEEAFRFLGSVPNVCVPDNTRRAVLRAAFGLDGPTELERSYRELAQRYGFMVDPAPPGAPRTRGKVEATVKWIRRNPLAARDGEPIDEVQAALERWNREVANTRVHGSTGRRPIDEFEAEDRPAMRPLPAAPVETAVWKRAKVHPDCHVTARGGRLFSVPWRLVHETVWVRASGRVVEMFHRDRRVAMHEDHGRRRTTLEEHLPEDRRDLRHRGRLFWEARAARIGRLAFELVSAVFDRDQVLSQLRQVQAIVKLLERHPRERAEAASQLVLRSGDPGYAQLKQVLAAALDVQPLAAEAGRRSSA